MKIKCRIGSDLIFFWNAKFGHAKFRLVDYNCIGYLALIALLLIFFHKTVDHWFNYVIVHLGVILLILDIIRRGERESSSRFFHFLRTFYPIAVLALGWREIDATGRMFFSSYWATDFIISFDYAIFGVYPTVWFQQFYHPLLDEIMTFFYSGFFLFMPIVTLSLYFQGKKQEAFTAFFIGTFIHLSNFILFRFLPILAPFMNESIKDLHPQQYTGYVFAEITRITQTNGAQRGGTFPSVHVSTAIGWALIAFRYQRNLGYALIPVSIGVAISTVYLGYHHGMDAIFGFSWGIVAYVAASIILKKRKANLPV